MTLVARMQDNLSAGTAITGSGTTHANLAGTSTYNVASPSTLVWATDSGAGTGQTVLHYSVSTGTDITRWNLNATNDFVAISILFKTPASAPSGNNIMMSVRHASGVALKFGFNSSNRPFVSDFASTLFFIANAGVLTANAWYRFEFLIHGNSTSTGTCGVNVYTPSGTTPISGTSQSFTGMNLTANTLAAVEVGNSSGSQPIDFYAANLQYDDGRTTEIGPLATQLATPTVSSSSGTWVNPTVVGGSNGSAIATWPAVANATSYEAWKANNGSPAQGDFSLVATGVTSPYTFTGLTGSTWALGIKAKA